MTQPNDTAWIRQALERHERSLVPYAARLIGDVERARDVVQETFLRLCKQERAEVEGHVEVWLFTVCRNLWHDTRRKESRMTELEDERAEGTAGTLEGPAQAAEQMDSHEQILRMISSLPEKQQEVLRLKFQHGLSYRSISEVTGESTGNVGWLIHVGLKALRVKLGAEAARGAEA